MEDTFFLKVPEEYEFMIENIKDNDIKNLFSKYQFLYLPFKSIPKNEEQIQQYLLNYFKKFKFITYNCIQSTKYLPISQPFLLNSKSNEVFAFFCVEKQCIFVDEINAEAIEDLINEIKKNSCVINANINIGRDQEMTDEIQEIKNFCSRFPNENKFVKQIMPAIAGYSIRRYFYPTHYFYDQSFFIYDPNVKINEFKIKERIHNSLISRFYYLSDDPYFFNEVEAICENKNSNRNIQEFEEKDFIVLRHIYSSERALLNLVIHLKSFYIFMMKKLCYVDGNKYYYREFDFCKNYSHRCLTPFYGILKNNGKVVGFIYEYMCNDTLETYISKYKIAEMQSLMIINRIFEGINYIHSNNLIFRDLKPKNILIDHDFIPYLSDFETICDHISEDDYHNINFTGDICSSLYASPEQNNGEYINFSTDIYSFGLIIYYLYQKKHMRNEKPLEKYMQENFIVPPIENCSQNMQDIYKNCIKFSPKERITDDKIKLMLIEEIASSFYLINDLSRFPLDIIRAQVKEFVLESIIIMKDQPNCINIYQDLVIIFKTVFSKDDISSIANEIGIFYSYIKNDFFNARKFDELSANMNNKCALINLGNRYFLGQGVEKNILKAKEYYEMAAKHNIPIAFLHLGHVYYIGENNVKDYINAIKYYEKAAKYNVVDAFSMLGCIYSDLKEYKKSKYYFDIAANRNHPVAFLNLGVMYRCGHGVKQDYIKAKRYFELASIYNIPDAFVNLGDLYNEGLGMEKNIIEARKYYEIAANFNDPVAFCRLGEFYLNNYDDSYLDKAKEYFELSAQQNNSKAIYYLGVFYIEGIACRKDYSKAIECFELSANLGNANALECLGKIYMEGIGVKKDFLKAKEYYELSASFGNYDVFVTLGLNYYLGTDVKQDFIKAKEYFELAAKQNNSRAFFYLGCLYYYGNGVKQDYLIAKNYFEQSANLLNSSALINLSYLYMNGCGVKKDFAKAKIYLELAASLNEPESFNALGNMYANGYGVEKNYRIAKEYFEKSAKQNNSNGFIHLGILYLIGLGVKVDYLKAKEYFEKSASLGDPDGCYYLGYIYLYGFGVEQDFQKAMEYFENSANQNDSKSLNQLGFMYLNGIGVKRNFAKAKEYYIQSVILGNSEAMYTLGTFYLNGFEVKKDFIKAKEYFEKSAKLNNSKALHCLGLIYKKWLGVEPNIQKAIEYYELSAKQFNSDALYDLGSFYLSGLGVKQDYKMAKKYYELSAQYNNHNAYVYLGLIYLKGYGVEPDLIKAKQYFELSDKNENPEVLVYLYIINEQLYSYNYGNLYGLSDQQKKSMLLFILDNLSINGYDVQQDYYNVKKFYDDSSEMKYKKNSYYSLDNNNIIFIIELLANCYFFGSGINQDYNRAKMYFEIGANLNSSTSQMFLGLMYFYGRGVKYDIAKAKKYFELSAKQKNSVAYLQLGYIYLSKKDYTKAIEYLNMSGKLNNSVALLYLGIIYLMGHYVCKDYLGARNYWEQSAQLENPIAYLYLGDYYCYLEYDVKDYSLAKKYYDIAAQYNIPEAFYSIGILYYYGLGVDKNYNEAKKYFEKATLDFIHPRALFVLGIMHIHDSNDKNCIPLGLSYLKLAAKYKNIDALSYLGNMYYNGIIFDVDCQKAIEYFLECSKYYNEKVLIYSNIFDGIIQKISYNQYRYTSLNNIGLIYLINMNNLDEAIKFIKEAAFAEYQHGQNNWGLIHQKYLNDIEKAKYWFQRASEHNFAISEYNLGFLYEKEGKTDKSIEYYLRASDDLEYPIIFQYYLYNDERLNISSLFIICLANLKLAEYFFSNKEYDKSKKYFIRSLYKIVNKNYRKFMFKLVNDEAKECFSHIKSLYLNFPLFNLQNSNLLSIERSIL